MLNIYSVLDYTYKGLQQKDPRFVIEDHETVKDVHTGIEFNLYDDYSTISHDDIIIMTMSDLTNDEKKVLWEIKEFITPEDVMKDKKENHEKYIRERRKEFSDLYANPKPISDESLAPEEDTVPYTGTP